MITVFAVMFNSCSSDDDDAPVLGAKVNVKVVNALGIELENRTVYMYKDTVINDDTEPGDANKSAVTNKDGIAEFSLNLTELNILESQTNLYFTVFYTLDDNSYPAPEVGLTIKRNETKDITLVIPV